MTTIEAVLEQVSALALDQHHVLVTAESCTGGMIAEAMTRLPGSSAWVEGGFVTYTEHAKTAYLDVAPDLIAQYGVVSEPVAAAMARGALARSVSATLAMSVTGIAGPGGGTPETPVGTVCLGWAERFNDVIVTYARTLYFSGDRENVRRAATLTALEGVIALMGHQNPIDMPARAAVDAPSAHS